MEFAVGIEVTRGCNYRCRHCFVDAGRPLVDEADTAELKRIVTDLAGLCCTDIGWSGGEPLLRRDLEELTAHAVGCGMHAGVATNGFLARPDRLRWLKKAGLGVVQISIDGTDAVRGERYREGPRGSYERSLRAVEDAAALGLRVYVCTILAPDTVGEVEEMMAFSRKLGAVGMRYTMWAPVGRAEGGSYDESAWRTPAVARFLDVVRQHPHGSAFPVLVDCPTGPLPWQWRFECTAGKATAYINARGDVYPCTALMTPEYLVGNLRERPAGDVFGDVAMRRVHRQRGRALPGGSCTGCDMAYACEGGCPGRAVAAFGSLRRGKHRGAMPVCLHRLHVLPDEAVA